CQLCHRSEADPQICGEKLQGYGLCIHEFCLLSSSMGSLQLSNGHSLPHREDDLVGLLGFLLSDIRVLVNQARRKRCCTCGQGGATINCCQTGCDQSFHLPCAREGGCATQYIPLDRAFCPMHYPEQAV
ncbi:PHF7 protein, partial [Sakesphorus luctuosus]|nr:PHF7 protein [Sakesphorus luctuosus]